MYLSRSTSRPARRRGAILLVVLTLLALFSVVGLSFALYAESEATNSRTRREAFNTNEDVPSQEQMASLFLSRLLYPLGDGYTGNALLSSIRGTDGATMVYGFHPTLPNDIPYNGVGTFHQQLTLPTATGTIAINRPDIINWGLHAPRDAAGNLVPAAIHAVDPEHTGFRNNGQVGGLPTTTYVSRAANYTYPDRNNPYVAVQDPTTGRIIEPSYVRRSLFNGNVPGGVDLTPGIDQRLAPPMSVNPTFNNGISNANNDDWLNAVGRYKSIRPRPTDHVFNSNDGRGAVGDFPYVPRNPDGSFTGDVQNLTNTEGGQRNDAVWVNAGLPVLNWRGKNIIPLVAATILPLDARVNVNTAGNTKNAGGHGSTHGFGPWEINLSKITSDATTMVEGTNGRATQTTFTPRGATGVTTKDFATNYTQAYAAVNWDAGTASAITYPTGNRSDPSYGTSGYDYTPAGTESDRHPGLLNPYSWNAFTNNARMFPFTDLRRANVKYAGKPSDYNAPFYGATAPMSLSTTGPRNAANQRRALLTTASNSIVRPGLQPNHDDYTTSTLALLGGNLVFTPPSLVHPVAVGATSSDFGGVLNLRAAIAALGPVNLNRTLADYRTAAGPLSFSNVTPTTVATAGNDRQTFARDVFVRLILATGAKAEITPAGTLRLPQPGPTPGLYTLVGADDTTGPQYDALRYLAQVAANVVDLIDIDDINSTFVWNPVVATPVNLYQPDVTSIADTANNFTPLAVMDRVVYGVEKPRAVLNEVYAEVTNGVNDINMTSMMAMEDFQVRFFVELCNPGTAGAAGTDTTHPLGDGRVTLASVGGPQAYKCQIYTDWTAISPAMNPADPMYSQRNLTGAVGFNPMMGTITAPPTRKFDVTLTAAGADLVMLPSISNAGTVNQNGFKLLAPQIVPATVAKTTANEFLPTVGGGDPIFNAAPYNTGLVPIPDGGGQNAFQYTVPRQNQMDIAGMTLPPLQNHAVVLRRLANPYIAANDPAEATFNAALTPNPYITVDAFGDMAAQDAIRVGMDGPRGAGPPVATMRTARGRTTPFYGYRGGSAMDSFTAIQTADPTKQGPDGQPWSLFNHNTNFTVDAEWLVHLDRNLINQTELLNVAGCKPHELLYRFAANPLATPTYNAHLAPVTTGSAPLHRALELLTVKPFGHGLPTEGRVPGKININMVWSKSVFEALLDQNGSSGFATTDVDAAWNVLQGLASDTADTNYRAYTRTKAGQIPGPTVDEVGGTTYAVASPAGTYGADRPFKGLGTAAFIPPAVAPMAPDFTLSPAGSGIADTTLRDGDTTGVPALSPASATHPYHKAEMLRKIFNNITTTSDTYLVVMTVGYFEVRNPGPHSAANPVVLGKEVYNEVLGDTRAKFVAVMDRSMIAGHLSAGGLQAAGPWQSEIAVSSPAPAPPPGTVVMQFRAIGSGVHPKDGATSTLAIDYEGQRYYVVPSTAPAVVLNDPFTTTQLRVGTGPVAGGGAQTATVTTIGFDINGDSTLQAAESFDSATGIATVVVTGLVQQPVVGAAVSNGIGGNPGQQTAFDANAPRYKGVVPYFEKVEIGK